MTDALATPQTAVATVRGSAGAVAVGVRMTPAGLLAIGGLVAGILLSTAVLVLAAGEVKATKRR